jgi:tyrosyl-tRNA synthetase
MPILPGTDGTEKMSKSLDNYIGINEPPRQIYGKTLSIPDNLIYDYFLLGTNISQTDLNTIKDQLSKPTTNPRDTKRRLARELVALYHGAEEATAAEQEFDRIFVKKDLPDEVPELSIPLETTELNIIKLLTESKLVASNGEARRMIEQGGVSVNGERVSDYNATVSLQYSVILKVGKRRFLKVSKA